MPGRSCHVAWAGRRSGALLPRRPQAGEITSAAISLIRHAAGPSSYALAVTVPRGGGRRALTAITTRAAGHQLAIIVAGIAWDIAHIEQPVTQRAFEILLAGKKQARILMRALSPPR